jgi:predicted permease
MARSFLDDVRLALRAFRKQPRFVGVAALTLALGIGSVTAIFSVVNGVLLKPLPFPEPDRIVNLWSNAAGLGFDQFALSPDLFYFFRRETKSFDAMTMFRRRDANLTDGGDPEVVRVTEADAGYFSTFRATPAVGQPFVAAHDAPGAPLVVLISDRLWQRRFARDRAILGKSVHVDGDPAAIVGVMPATLDENGSSDLWLPARLDAAHPPTGSFGWLAAARLKAAVSVETAEREFAPLVKRLLDGGITAPDYRAFLADGKYRVLVHSAREDLVGDLRQPLWILLGTVAFVLLIACANVANLCLIRAEGRQKELAVRAALGATRGALVRKQLVEAMVLAAIGGGLGVAFASLAVPALIRAAPSTIPRLAGVHMDGLVFAVAIGAMLLAAAVFGVVPAFRYTRPATLEALRHGGRGATADRSRHRGRQLLVVVQTAMTLVLLIGSGLLVRSFSRMLQADLGFNPHNVLTFRVALPSSSYPDAARILDFDRRLLERLAAIPGVDSVGATSNLPLISSVSGTAFTIDGRPTPAGQRPPLLPYTFTAPGDVEAIGIRVLRGRAFDRRDLTAGSRDVLVTQTMAERFWPNQDPIGRRLRPSTDQGETPGPWFTVAGVVSSERHDGLRAPPPVLVYWALGAPFGTGARGLSYVLRGPRVAQDAAAVRAAVRELDPGLPVAIVQTMDEILARSIAAFTFTMLTLGLAAIMALVLGTVGLYGLLSYAVTLRVREIGVRLALGAQPSGVMRAIVGQGVAIVAVGLVVGVGGAVALTRLLSELLYDTKPLDVTTFAATCAALLVVAVTASYLPARRAASVSPLESLRSE